MAEQKNEVVEQKKRELYITDYLALPAVKDQIVNVLGDKEAMSFVSDVVACVQNNPGLAKCTNVSIFSGALLAKTNGLTLNPSMGHAYLVPFDNKKKDGTYVKEAQFQMGYKGFIQLGLRSGQYKKIITSDVRKGEIVNYDPFNDVYEFEALPFEKRMAKDNKGQYEVPVIGYYAKFELMNGFAKEMYMSLEDMTAFAKKYSKAYRNDIEKHYSYSFWTTKFDDMAKKTMLRQLLGKWGLLTAELQNVYAADMGVIGENGEISYVDNQPDDRRETKNPMGDEEIIVDSTAVDIEMPENFK